MNATPDSIGTEQKDTPLLPLRPVAIALIGVTASDRNTLLDAFEQLPDDRILYRPVPLHMRPDVLLVNADDARALASWVRYRNYAREMGIDPPSVVISQARTFDTAHYQLTSPLESGAVLELLRRVNVERLQAVSARLAEQPSEIPYPSHLDATALPPKIVSALVNSTSVDEGSKPSLPAVSETVSPLVDASEPASRALVIDDSLPVRIQMRQALQPLSWHIDFASNGEQALSLLDSYEYRIVFIAPQLGDIDGYEVCRRAKQLGAKDAPVVMLTSASSPADRVKGQEAGCDTYLIKPVTPQVLRQLLDQYLAIG